MVTLIVPLSQLSGALGPLLLLALLGLILAAPGIAEFRRNERTRRVDRDYRASALLLWAKQHAAMLKRQRAGEGIEV